MDRCGEMYESIEGVEERKENQKAHLVLQEFSGKTGIDIEYNESITSAMAELELLKQNISDFPEYIPIFYEILKKYGYSSKADIKECILYLGGLENPSKNREIINILLSSPLIEDISYDGKGQFTIYNENYENISFQQANTFFNDNKDVIQYLKKTSLRNGCYQHTEYLADIYPNFYSTVSLCTGAFGNKYYHAYTETEDKSQVIDLCYSAVISKEEYKKIWEPSKIITIENENLSEIEMITSQKSNQNPENFSLLRIALYQQYLDSIGYQGTMQEAPYVKEKVQR